METDTDSGYETDIEKVSEVIKDIESEIEYFEVYIREQKIYYLNEIKNRIEKELYWYINYNLILERIEKKNVYIDNLQSKSDFFYNKYIDSTKVVNLSLEAIKSWKKEAMYYKMEYHNHQNILDKCLSNTIQDTDKCLVCWKHPSQRMQLIFTSCGHWMCRNCFKRLLSYGMHNCPKCRFDYYKSSYVIPFRYWKF